MKTLAVSSFALALAQISSAHADDFALQLVDQSGRPVERALVTLHPLDELTPRQLASRDLQMSQRNLEFVPGVLIAPVGSSVSFPNEDNTGHHVYSFSDAKQFDLRIIAGGESEAVVFDQPGTVAIGCNIHDNMVGFIHVVDTPWAEHSDDSGTVEIEDVPNGRFEVRIWHERLSARGQTHAFETELGDNRELQTHEIEVRRARQRRGRY